MILVRWVWLALPLFAQALSPVANSTPVSAHLISLSDPYRGIRPSCLADLDPASCERLPIPPQNVPEGICVENNSQGNSSCVADAIAKTEATLEEKLQDLKESLAQDGVIPDDFVTFEKWKAGQFQVLQDSGDDKNPKRDEDPIEKKALGVNSSTADISVLKGKWETPSIEDSGDKHSRKNRRLSTPLDNTQRSPKATAQQKASSLSPHRYNYASPDCSARIHSASPQSQHASSVLHKSKDRYMLTPCSAKEHWVIIELCDDIRIEAVEIGMFEFFSGIVKEVKLSIGGADDDEEVQDEDKSAWQEVGSFIGKSVRGTQTFTLDHPTSFQRFIRLDFPTHYGNEYYCPVSSIKVYGMNQMEAFKWESRRQKEAEMNRKRLEENAKRALETVTIAGTILPQVPPSRSSHAAENTTESAVAGSSTHKSMEVVSATPAAGSGQAAGSTPLTSISDATVAHAATQATTLETFDTGGPLPTGTSSMHDIGRQAIDTKMISPSLPVSNINVPPPTTTSLSPSPKGASNTLPDSLSEASSSVLLTDDVLPNAPKYSTSQPAIPRQEVRADSSESIYAYIIRRLNALEANSTLGMMYMEEQTKATRGILQRLENHLADWKAQINSSHQLAILQEVSVLLRSSFILEAYNGYSLAIGLR
ncbi:hypothetical protein QFC19_005506 [Naganishia cerealis]|uniref:Uncharacterized protein n=1 Tax=Naganishia cerealis TaxID=610337 RepID=A0ACC2VPG6_9TREE|nr:hypothetical protein QFC19_005506 [Naganishia cerealis]